MQLQIMSFFRNFIFNLNSMKIINYRFISKKKFDFMVKIINSFIKITLVEDNLAIIIIIISSFNIKINNVTTALLVIDTCSLNYLK